MIQETEFKGLACTCHASLYSVSQLGQPFLVAFTQFANFFFFWSLLKLCVWERERQNVSQSDVRWTSTSLMWHACGGQRTTLWSQFSSTSCEFQGFELEFLDLNIKHVYLLSHSTRDFKRIFSWTVLAYSFNPGSQEAKASRPLSSRPPLST